ncbi:hypothetical protein FS749_011591 [Ceratobasidium sp. UAMH 11750]|nr:hypothetical protein FS749_011591 [Ceratobasidium sp. UAMH 11750]
MVTTYYRPAGAAEAGSVAATSGELKFMPGDSEGEVDASSFHPIASAEHADKIDIPVPMVSAVGPIVSTEGREWVLSVATYDQLTRSHKTFTICVLVPPASRFSNLRTPAPGQLVSVRSVLASITTEEVAAINLEAVTFISITNINRPLTLSSGSTSASSPTGRPIGRTKRECHQEQDLTPSKKIRIGAPSMFLTGPDLAVFSGAADDSTEASTSHD